MSEHVSEQTCVRTITLDSIGLLLISGCFPFTGIEVDEEVVLMTTKGEAIAVAIAQVRMPRHCPGDCYLVGITLMWHNPEQCNLVAQLAATFLAPT